LNKAVGGSTLQAQRAHGWPHRKSEVVRMKKLLVAALFTIGWGLVGAAPAVAAESQTPFCGLMTGTPVLNCTYTEAL